MKNLPAEHIAATQKVNADAMMELMQTTLNNMERLAALNLSTLRDAIVEDSQRLSDGIPPMPASPNEIAEPSLARTQQYYHMLYEWLLGMQRDISDIMEHHYHAMSSNAAQSIDEASKQLPSGGDFFTVAMQSMLQASTQTFDRMHFLSQQMQDLADQNLQAMQRLGHTFRGK